MDSKIQKRQCILQSARTLFRDRGFHDTKMEDIAVLAGVGKGTLYEYFKNKQEIFDEACIEYFELIIKKINNICTMQKTFREKLLILFNEKAMMESEFANIGIDNILSSKNIISEKTVKIIMSKMLEMYGLIYNIIDQGKDEGVIIKDIPSEIIACSIVGTMTEYLKLKLHKKEYEIKEYNLIIDLLYNGFAVKE